MTQKMKKNGTIDQVKKEKCKSWQHESELGSVAEHEFMMDKFNEMEKNIQIEIDMIQKELKSRENKIQLKKDNLEKIELEVKQKNAEIAEKILAADEKLANLQTNLLDNEARCQKQFMYLEERIDEMSRASSEMGNVCIKNPLTWLDSVGEEKEDGEY